MMNRPIREDFEVFCAFIEDASSHFLEVELFVTEDGICSHLSVYHIFSACSGTEQHDLAQISNQLWSQ
jgi:hypothetical protein